MTASQESDSLNKLKCVIGNGYTIIAIPYAGWEESPVIERTFDETCGIIRVRVSGPWDIPELDDHYAKLRELIETVRARGIPIRILVDVRHAPPRSAAVEARIADHKDTTYRVGDKVAILTANAADKDHVRALFDGAEKWGWQSELAAEQWLLLPDDPAKPQPQPR